MLYSLLLALQIFTLPIVIHKPFRNVGKRDTLDNYVIIHYDSGVDIPTTLRYLHKKKNSYHYIIDRIGVIYKLIDPAFKANHAGPSHFDTLSDLNDYSIGICLQGSGTVPFTDAQYSSLKWLLDVLKKRYPDLTYNKITGHENVAIPFGRKHDPGPLFDWFRLYNSLSWQTIVH